MWFLTLGSCNSRTAPGEGVAVPDYSTESVNIGGSGVGYYVPYDAATFNFGTTMTAAAWVKDSAAGGIVQTFFAQYNQSGPAPKWNMQFQSTGEYQAVVSTSSQNKIYRSTASYTDGVWRHFAFTWGSSGTLKVYVNAVELTVGGGTLTKVSDPVFTTLNPVSNAVTVGGRWSSPASISNGINGGNIDQPMLANTEFSAAQISELYNGGKPFDLSTHSQSANIVWWARCGEDALDTALNLQDQVGTNHGIGSSGGSGITIVTDAP